MAVTVADVARRAGVSTASVSRALSGADGVSAAVRERVVAAAQALGYRPNTVARSLRTTRTQTIGLIIPDMVNPFFSELAWAIEEAAHEHGYSVILCNANEETDRQDGYIELLLARRVDGLLLTPVLEESEALRAVARQGVPMVFVDRSLASMEAPVVRADGSLAISQLVDHLVDLGHERIAVITGPQATVTGRERLAAFRTAMRARSLDLPDELVRFGNFQADSGRRAAVELLDLDEPPTAVFAIDNLMTLGVFQEMRRRGLRIGSDIAVAGFDDPPWFQLLDPPLTTVSQPVTRMGALAVDMLLEAINAGSVESHLLDCALVIRESCGETAAPRETFRSRHMPPDENPVNDYGDD
ncbi:LacI family transcriptional regulator [Streptomyces humidus]|uniref:LacI family transcriptional regulator n=1 Tax=Streptomyces humidus TaxID=52259 RepID=A0A918FTI1_9ACTN|nr:LacI family DNA-binding transcriptional regulator [Streptomyces humidus]GGR79448.1 LacI family transcriptional regulator [Streptomyces humidus]